MDSSNQGQDQDSVVPNPVVPPRDPRLREYGYAGLLYHSTPPAINTIATGLTLVPTTQLCNQPIVHTRPSLPFWTQPPPRIPHVTWSHSSTWRPRYRSTLPRRQ